jgi:NTE family protein
MNKTSIEEITNAQKQPFTCASFSGGGAKGTIYSGTHEALSKTGIIKNLEAVAGSSAGSIIATCIATGIKSEKFKKISQETNLKGLLGDGGVVNKDGKPLLELMRNTIRTNISEYLEDVNVVDLCNQRLDEIKQKKSELNDLPEKEQQEYLAKFNKQEEILNDIIKSGGEQINDIKKKSLDPNGKILFKDVALLRVLDPQTFKDLVITATRRDTGDLEIFSTQNTPDVEIALACRASASIPIVFEPVTINGHQYVDGGYRDNIPLNSFDKDKTEESKDITDSKTENSSS